MPLGTQLGAAAPKLQTVANAWPACLISLVSIFGTLGCARHSPRVIEPELSPDAHAASESAVLAGFRSSVTTLATVQPGRPWTDLSGFGAAVGNARLVSLGEATHGTSEILQMKHRLFEYLVREKGFTVFAIEGNWPETAALDRYIKTGEGDPKEGLKALYVWPWQTAELLALVEWMRAFNHEPGSHPILSFTGFDMQRHEIALDELVQAVRGTPDGQFVEAVYAMLRDVSLQPGPELKAAADTAESVLRILQQRRPNTRILHLAEVVAQALRHRSGEIRGYRDQMMAKNVEWLINEAYPREKVVVWAHNAHVSAMHEPQYQGGRGTRWMGNWLRETIGSQMYILGFAIDAGSVRARRVVNGTLTEPIENTLPPSPQGTGSWLLSRVGVPMFFLDIRTVRGGLAAWLDDEHLFRDIGAGWSGDQPPMNPWRLARMFDGMIFLRETSASRRF